MAVVWRPPPRLSFAGLLAAALIIFCRAFIRQNRHPVHRRRTVAFVRLREFRRQGWRSHFFRVSQSRAVALLWRSWVFYRAFKCLCFDQQGFVTDRFSVTLHHFRKGKSPGGKYGLANAQLLDDGVGSAL